MNICGFCSCRYDIQADRAVEELELSEREDQLKILGGLLKVQGIQQAKEKAALTFAAKIVAEVVDEMVRNIYSGHRYTLRKASHIVAKPLVDATLAGQSYLLQQRYVVEPAQEARGKKILTSRVRLQFFTCPG